MEIKEKLSREQKGQIQVRESCETRVGHGTDSSTYIIKIKPLDYALRNYPRKDLLIYITSISA